MNPDLSAVLRGERRYAVIHADARDVLPTLPDRCVDITCVDPPYSERIHRSVRTRQGDLTRGRHRAPAARVLTDGNGRIKTRAAICRIEELGFEHLTASLRRFCASQFARLTQRWVMAFSDVESCHLWRHSFDAAGLEYVRTLEWRRIGGAPQFSGDRPSSGFETITLAHPRGRKSWNGGGKSGSYEYPIVANRSGHRADRVHTTQKPEPLLYEMLADFALRDDVVLDCFAGSGTCGAAALRLGLRYIGVELKREYTEIASARLAAIDTADATLPTFAAKQIKLGGVR